jgi:hypothetical protein
MRRPGRRGKTQAPGRPDSPRPRRRPPLPTSACNSPAVTARTTMGGLVIIRRAHSVPPIAPSQQCHAGPGCGASGHCDLTDGRGSDEAAKEPGPCPPRARKEGHPRRFTVIHGATDSAPDLYSRRSAGRVHLLCKQGVSWRRGSHAGSHRSERPSAGPDGSGQQPGANPSVRTSLNDPARPCWCLRICECRSRRLWVDCRQDRCRRCRVTRYGSGRGSVPFF